MRTSTLLRVSKNCFESANRLHVTRPTSLFASQSRFSTPAISTQSTEKTSDKPTVIIIGAGIAGLTAAYHLLKTNKVNVCVLEAKNYIGGRVHTDSNMAVDLGASWIHECVKSNTLFQLSKKVGMAYHWCDYDNAVFYDEQGTQCTYATKDGLLKIYDALFYDAASKFNALTRKRTTSTSMMDAIMPIVKTLNLPPKWERILMALVITDINITIGLHPSKASALNNFASEYADLSEDNKTIDSTNPIGLRDVFITQGWDNLIRYLAKDVSIELTCPINSISYKSQDEQKPGTPNVTIHTQSGAIYSGDYVLVTVPLGVMQQNAIKFMPALPDNKLKALDKLVMGTLCKIVLEFPSPFWETNAEVLHYLRGKDEQNPDNDKVVHWFLNVHYVSRNLKLDVTNWLVY